MASYDPAWLDRVYDNRALVADHAKYLAQWTDESAAARAQLPCRLDLPYATGDKATLDIFPPAAAATASGIDKSASRSSKGAPVLFFIHGGYWRALDKSDMSFVARAFTERGVCVVVPNYALCPGTPEQPVGIADIALQMAHALAWTWRHIAQHGGDPDRITIAGHSAGGHLTGMLMGCDWRAVAPDLPPTLLRNGLSISGLYDLTPIRHTPFLADALRLDDDEARRLSPAFWPAPAHGTLYSVAGADESEEFVRQNALIREAWGARVVPVCEALPGLHHFSILDGLVDPAHRLHGLAVELLGV